MFEIFKVVQHFNDLWWQVYPSRELCSYAIQMDTITLDNANHNLQLSKHDLFKEDSSG